MRTTAAILSAAILSLITAAAQTSGESDRLGASPTIALWRDPTDIASRNLLHGAGGREHAPHGPFTFLKEDLGGSSPKFYVRDHDGVEWKVKLGLEARPETAATRIVWAAGYYTKEEYLVRELRVAGLPAHLHRGESMVGPNRVVRGARMQREVPGEEKIGRWRWRQNPFRGSRELNGLRVVMALINNWDLKDGNNAIYQMGSRQVYLVSDLGASFASSGRVWPSAKAKGNLESYRASRFIRDIRSGAVDFQTPARPGWVLIVDPKEYFSRVCLEWIGRDIPLEDARWIGKLLARLSLEQISDAFRAAGYSDHEVEGFASVVEHRILSLAAL